MVKNKNLSIINSKEIKTLVEEVKIMIKDNFNEKVTYTNNYGNNLYFTYKENLEDSTIIYKFPSI